MGSGQADGAETKLPDGPGVDVKVRHAPERRPVCHRSVEGSASGGDGDGEREGNAVGEGMTGAGWDWGADLSTPAGQSRVEDGELGVDPWLKEEGDVVGGIAGARDEGEVEIGVGGALDGDAGPDGDAHSMVEGDARRCQLRAKTARNSCSCSSSRSRRRCGGRG